MPDFCDHSEIKKNPLFCTCACKAARHSCVFKPQNEHESPNHYKIDKIENLRNLKKPLEIQGTIIPFDQKVLLTNKLIAVDYKYMQFLQQMAFSKICYYLHSYSFNDYESPCY